jgi:hypothetical protein
MVDTREAALTVLARAPEGDRLTAYDVSHFLTYARLLDADRAGADWRKASSDILLCDFDRDPEGTWACWHSHLLRARWILEGR